MSFFKNLFSKGESYVPTPTQEVPGLQPIVVQAIEIVFPNLDDQKQAFACILELQRKVRMCRDPKMVLGLISYSNGQIKKLQEDASITHPHFWFDEISTIFPNMKAAKAWVKAITSQA